MTVYGYARVSTQRQATEGESLGVQQRQIEGYALVHGLDLSGVYVEEGVSGSTPLGKRPRAAEMMSLLRAGDVVITAKLDRMFRSASDALTTLEWMRVAGMSLHMIDLGGDVLSNGMSKLVFTIMSAVAESERDRIRERVSQVKADQQSRGAYLGGGVPLGFRVNGGTLVQDAAASDAKAALDDLVRRHVDAGKPSMRDIAKIMKSEHGVTISHLVPFRMARKLREGEL